jgi:hypothetical protein
MGQTPREGMAETSEEAAGLFTAAQAIGTLDHHHVLKDSRRRVEDSHRAGQKALGFDMEEPGDYPIDKGDGVGDSISVSGDHIHVILPGDNPPPRRPDPKPDRSPNPNKWMPALALGALLTGGGLGGATWWLLNRTTEPPVDTDTRRVIDAYEPD